MRAGGTGPVLCHGRREARNISPPCDPSIADLLAAGEPLVLPGVYDALSARLAVEAGFRAVFLSGYASRRRGSARPTSGCSRRPRCSRPRAGVRRGARAPVIVDIDTGYGDAFNVERTVEELLRMGAAGCFLEDQVWPKRCGHMEGKRVVPLEEYLPKLRAALGARGDAPFHVTARTDARAVAGLDEAIRRARAFADAGADAVFVEAPESIEEMARVRAAVPARRAAGREHGRAGEDAAPDRRASSRAAGYRMVVVPVAGPARLGARAAPAVRDAAARRRHRRAARRDA